MGNPIADLDFSHNLIDEDGNTINILDYESDELIEPIEVDDDGNFIDFNVEEDLSDEELIHGGAKKKYNKYVWTKLDQRIILNVDEFNMIFDRALNTFKTSNYVKFIGDKLNKEFGDISCVIRSDGCDPGLRKKKTIIPNFTLRFGCRHKLCSRQYKLKTIKWGPSYEFEVTVTGDIQHSSRGLGRELSGNDREEVREILAKTLTKNYRSRKIQESDKELRSKGNLQDVYSEPTLRRVRCEGLALQDMDQNDIMDLFKRREKQILDVKNKTEESEIFLQNVSAGPFFVFSFSEQQIQVLLKMISDGDIVVLYVDATGSVVAAPQGITNRIYYYTGLLSLSICDEETAVLFPLLEMVSASHDAYTIGCWLRKFRFTMSQVTNKWPVFNHLVSDFSYAILNAAADALNRETLIDHVNNTFLRIVNGGLLEDALVVFLHICCNHFMKTVTKDINIFFPKENSSTKVRTLLKEVIAAMFNMSDLETIAAVYKNLYILLTSKFVSEKVPLALKALIELATAESTAATEDETETGNEIVNDEEILTYDETITYETVYERSLFYQHFKKMNSHEDFTVSKSVNSFFHQILPNCF